MNSSNRLLVIIGSGFGALILVALIAIYLLGGRSNDQNPGLLTRLQNGIAAVTGTPSRISAGPSGPFAFRRLEIDVSKPQAEACLVFTRTLDAGGRTHYEDYLTIDPSVRIAARVMDTRLCLAGLDFNKTYNVTLKAGLPSAGGDKLAEEEAVPVELRDKPSLLRFAGGIILPRENTAGVPVTTVNISKLTLKIIRVGDRLLSQIQTGTIDSATLYSWGAKELENNQGTLVWQGTMAVDNIKNESVVTLIPIHQLLKDDKPGACPGGPGRRQETGEGRRRLACAVGDAVGGGQRHRADQLHQRQSRQRVRPDRLCPLVQPGDGLGGGQAHPGGAQQQCLGIGRHRREWPGRFRRWPVQRHGR